jgi:uncharacterized repeat protein (TIGR01451 family)
MDVSRRHLSARRRAAISCAASAAVAIVCAAPASAGTAIGSADVPTISCSANTTVVQQTSGSSSPSYAVPADGLITSWSYQAKAAPGTRRLKVFRATGTSGQFVVVGESATETPAPNQLNSFGTRVPVTQGDRIGFFTATGDDGCRRTAGSGDQAAGRVGTADPAVGTTISSTFFASSTLIDVGAVVEPDSDRDGYGDETQDKCLGDANVFDTPCQADLAVTLTANAAHVKLGDAVTYTFTVRNLGPTAATGVVLTDVLPQKAPVASVSAGCRGFTTIKCTAGTLPSGGAPKTFTITIRAPEVGELRNAVSASSATFDPVADNNFAAVALSVQPRAFTGVPVRRGRFHASRGSVRLQLSCPVAAWLCAGKLVMREGRKASGRVAGKAAFRVRGGARKTIRVKLSKRARSIVARKGRLSTLVTASSTDSFGQRATKRALVVVLREKKRRR